MATIDDVVDNTKGEQVAEQEHPKARIPISGIVHVTGEPDTGKTTFALECGYSPEQIVFIDADVKGRVAVQQLMAAGVKFGQYYDMVTLTKGLKEIQIYETYMKIFNSFVPGQYKAIVIDPFTQFESSIFPVVMKNPRNFRDNYSPMGVIKTSEMWQASFAHESEVLARLTECFEMVILTSHLKSYYVGNKRVDGKFVPDCKAIVTKQAFFRLWLRRNPESAVPVALVLKRLSRKGVVNGKIRTDNVLPPKLVPRSDEVSLWDVIERYWNSPFGNAKPGPKETPDEYELSILEGTLTADQRIALKIALQETEEDSIVIEAAKESIGDDELLAVVKDLLTENPNDDSAVINSVTSIYDVPLPKLMKAIKAAKYGPEKV